MLNIALVTGTENHHYYWVYELQKKINVKLIFLINNSNKKKYWRKKPMQYGFFWFLLKCISLIYHRFSSNSFSKELKRKETEYFGIYKNKFEEISSELVHYVKTINSSSNIKLIKSNQIDFICFLGGDIASDRIINASKKGSLNYHSGLSPIYNGSKTIFHAMSDFRPNLAGGTLMYINKKIDGGAILAHFLPQIKENDKATDLFLKNIQGAVDLYLDYFDYVKKNNKPEGVEQERYLKYFRNIDWTFINDIKLNNLIKHNINKKYLRDKTYLHYFDLEKDDMDKILSKLYSKTLKKS